MDIYKEFADPIYRHLMGHTQIFKLSIEEQLIFKSKFKEIVNKVDDNMLKQLLWDNNWRCSLVGAWLIFSKNKIDFIDAIGKLLLQGKDGTIGYCYALAKFGTINSSQYLFDYLDKELRFEKFPNEKFQDTALYALIYIDKKNKTEYAKSILTTNGLWDKFVNFEFLRLNHSKLSNSSRWGKIEKNYSDFKKMFGFIDHN